MVGGKSFIKKSHERIETINLKLPEGPRVSVLVANSPGADTASDCCNMLLSSTSLSGLESSGRLESAESDSWSANSGHVSSACSEYSRVSRPEASSSPESCWVKEAPASDRLEEADDEEERSGASASALSKAPPSGSMASTEPSTEKTVNVDGPPLLTATGRSRKALTVDPSLAKPG